MAKLFCVNCENRCELINRRNMSIPICPFPEIVNGKKKIPVWRSPESILSAAVNAANSKIMESTVLYAWDMWISCIERALVTCGLCADDESVMREALKIHNDDRYPAI